jgi:hypothetical protein
MGGFGRTEARQQRHLLQLGRGSCCASPVGPGMVTYKISKSQFDHCRAPAAHSILLAGNVGRYAEYFLAHAHAHDTGGPRYVSISRTDGSPVTECIMDWELVNINSGEARALPKRLC